MTFLECIFPRACETIVDYFRLVSRYPDYYNVPPEIDETEIVPPELQDPKWSDDEGDGASKDADGKGGSKEDELDKVALERAMEAVNISMGKGENADANDEGQVRGDDKA